MRPVLLSVSGPLGRLHFSGTRCLLGSHVPVASESAPNHESGSPVPEVQAIAHRKYFCDKLPVLPSVQAAYHYPVATLLPRPDLQSRTGRNRRPTSSRVERLLFHRPEGLRILSALTGPLQKRPDIELYSRPHGGGNRNFFNIRTFRALRFSLINRIY